MQTASPRTQPAASPAPKPKLLDQVRIALRSRHYSKSTEQTYVHWIKRYIFFPKVRHPAEMGEAEVNEFLSHLAINGNVSPSTQNQALSALLFLYRYVLDRQLGELGKVIRDKKSSWLPVVLTDPEDFSFSICDLSFAIGENNPPPADKEYR